MNINTSASIDRIAALGGLSKPGAVGAAHAQPPRQSSEVGQPQDADPGALAAAQFTATRSYDDVAPWAPVPTLPQPLRQSALQSLPVGAEITASGAEATRMQWKSDIHKWDGKDDLVLSARSANDGKVAPGEREKVIILGAAGRDFHNFNTLYRNNPDVEVVAFTATQIPGIGGRRYPASLAGNLYPNGIPVHAEDDLESIIQRTGATRVVFSYSDVSHEHVLDLAQRTVQSGADFVLGAPHKTMLQSTKPVVSVTAVRTGCGKSQTSRHVAETLMAQGLKVAVIRHPMPYGDLQKQACQRFPTYESLAQADCTVEEREEYEPYVRIGAVVFAGVDYEQILRRAEAEADVIIWDGGNNDTPFVRPDFDVVLTDPHRVGHGLNYYPGDQNLKRAGIIAVAKTDTAPPENVVAVEKNARNLNPNAIVTRIASKIGLVDSAQESLLKPTDGKPPRALVVEDGPSHTHGGLTKGAGTYFAERHDCELVDARSVAAGSIVDTYRENTNLPGSVLPAMGYSPQQLEDLRQTIRAAKADVVISGTPIDLSRLIGDVGKPVVQVRYDYADPKNASDAPAFTKLLGEFASDVASKKSTGARAD